MLWTIILHEPMPIRIYCPDKWQQCCFRDLDEQRSIHYALNNTNSGFSSPTYPCPHMYVLLWDALPWVYLRWLSNLSAAMSLLRLHFNGAFICPDHVLKIIGPIDCSPRQTFDLDAFSYHLIIGRTPECLAENFSSYQYHGKAKVDMFLL